MENEVEDIPVRGRGEPIGLREVKVFPDFKDIRFIDGGEVVGLTRRPRSTLQEDFGTMFVLFSFVNCCGSSRMCLSVIPWKLLGL
jgi:hypothetical protein